MIIIMEVKMERTATKTILNFIHDMKLRDWVMLGSGLFLGLIAEYLIWIIGIGIIVMFLYLGFKRKNKNEESA